MHDKTVKYNKTRIAPTPSGYLHHGNVLSFSITAALAKKSGADILLRIDDLDQARVNLSYIQDIFDTLNFLDIPWDEGPRTVKEFEKTYSQLHRMEEYHLAVEKLISRNLAFSCTCSRAQLSKKACTCLQHQGLLNSNDPSCRLITNDDEFTIKTVNGGNIVGSLPRAMENFAIRRRDGLPAYQLTSVIDDLFYGIDLVVRGDDLWPSTWAQHQLASALGEVTFNHITFVHHPLLRSISGEKLSKSAGATSVRYWREKGCSAADIFGLIAEMLGLTKTVTNWEQLSMATNFF